MSDNSLPSVSFTSKNTGIASQLLTKCSISLPARFEDFQKVRRGDYVGLWDTGASGTVISKKAANDLGLVPVGMTQVSHAAGISQVPVYLINLYLPNKVCIGFLQVTEGVLNGFDVLIGMDVITKGDFSITNADGQSWFTFRIPSLEHRDFVQEDNDKINPPIKENSNPFVGASRNQPCPCGSGKKYKHCHGK